MTRITGLLCGVMNTKARKYMLKAVEYADLVKVSEEELWAFGGK